MMKLFIVFLSASLLLLIYEIKKKTVYSEEALSLASISRCIDFAEGDVEIITELCGPDIRTHCGKKEFASTCRLFTEAAKPDVPLDFH